MEAKHTPGPWEASRGIDKEPDRWVVTVVGPKPWGVATIENGAPGDTLKTEEANARLFAAAPELLRELKHLVRLLEPLERDGGLNVPGLATLNGARAAIAKAEGH